jgi:hypothetical protein
MEPNLTESEYMTIQNQVVIMAQAVKGMDLKGFIAAVDRAETVGPIFNPTLYRKAEKNMGIIKALAQKLLSFQEEAENSLPSRKRPKAEHVA